METSTLIFLATYQKHTCRSETMPALMSTILWDLAFPCLLSAFSLLQLAFLQMTQIKMASPKLSSETCVSLIITSHFCLSIASNILWALHKTLRVVWLMTQVIFSIWGLIVCFTFFCGCMRLLRSVIKLPVIFLSQADSVGYENKGVLPLKMIKKGSLPPINGELRNPSQKTLAPKIRITDENDQTFSYLSDTSQPNLTEIPPGETTPCSPSLQNPISPSSAESDQEVGILQSPDLQHKVNRGNNCFSQKDDPVHSELLMKDKKYEKIKSTVMDDQGEQGPMLPFQKQPLTISALHKGTMFVQQSLRISSQLKSKDDFKFNAHKLKPSRRSRVEKLLRRILAVAFLGVLLCLLQGYGVFGPHGLSAGHRTVEIIPWFCYQTLCRIVELSMGCFMTVITRHTLHSHCHHTCGIGIKHRESLFT